ncbi:MAG: hypothetical protein AB7N73_09960 [Gemmatimonadales bacterium]
MTDQAQRDAVRFVHRLRHVKTMTGLIGLALVLVVGALFWIKEQMFSIQPGDAAPLGHALRTERHIAQLLQTLEPYTPSPNRDHSRDTYRLSLLLVPLDGGPEEVVEVRRRLAPNSFALARILGDDGEAIWFDAGGVGAVRLRTLTPIDDADLGTPPARRGASALPLGPSVDDHLAAGVFTSPTTWLGLHSPDEAARDLRPGFSLRRVRDAESARVMRRLHRAVVHAEGIGGRHAITAAEVMDTAEYLGAAFIRLDRSSEPLRLGDPDGVLMIYTSTPGLRGTLVVARVDLDGTVRWSTDTGLDRFLLTQILPGEGSTAFIGTRPAVPGTVSEPLLVIVAHERGTMRTVSLARR